MNKELEEKYNSLVVEYREKISDKFNSQDFIKENEIRFSAHSCAIEGNSFSVDETRTLKEKGFGMIPQGKTLLEAFEILDHFQAYEHILQHLDEPLTETLLKETHRLLTEHTLAFRTKYDEVKSLPGEYTTVNIAASFHVFFEYLHPFRDGNGRLGRLMSNFILLKNNLPLLIIPKEKREEYISALKAVKKEGTHDIIVEFFYKTSIESMEKEIEENKNMTENFTQGFDFLG